MEYLVQLLETPEFKGNTIDTSWLDGLIAAKVVSVQVLVCVCVLCWGVFRVESALFCFSPLFSTPVRYPAHDLVHRLVGRAVCGKTPTRND